jgi:chemotaxis protein histidine kinase CheA
MVKTQVEALGGTIQINSKLGEGTEFIIQFPV